MFGALRYMFGAPSSNVRSCTMKKSKEVKRMVDHKALKESPMKKAEKEKLKSKLKSIKTKEGY